VRWRVLVCVLGLLTAVTAGCGDDGERAGAAAASSAATSASVSVAPPSPSPTVDRAAVQARARAALIAPDGLVPAGGARAPKEDDDRLWAFESYCAKGVTANAAGVSTSSRRVWSGIGLYVAQVVHANSSVPGTAIVAELRANAAACKQYTQICEANCSDITMLGPVELAVPTGAEAAFALCERRDPPNAGPYHYCQAYLVRGTVVSLVSVTSGGTLGQSQSAMKKVVPIAAAALAKA